MFPETSRFCSKYLDKVRIKYLKNICLYFYKYYSNIISRHCSYKPHGIYYKWRILLNLITAGPYGEICLAFCH